MSKDDRERAEARINKITRAAQDVKTGKTERDASAKAVLDNMARLKALRLAREAAEPPPAPVAAKKARAKPGKSGEKAPTLTAWLESQQNSGRRT
jgi:hypothetical protein